MGKSKNQNERKFYNISVKFDENKLDNRFKTEELSAYDLFKFGITKSSYLRETPANILVVYFADVCYESPDIQIVAELVDGQLIDVVTRKRVDYANWIVPYEMLSSAEVKKTLKKLENQTLLNLYKTGIEQLLTIERDCMKIYQKSLERRASSLDEDLKFIDTFSTKSSRINKSR